MVDPVELLQKAFPGVNRNVLAAIADLSTITTYPPDTVLCFEGDAGDTFYLVGSGRVCVTKQMSDGEDHLLREGEKGFFFGEMALLHDTTRSATVTTAEETTVLELDRRTFVAAVQQNPSMVLTLIRTMIDRMRANDAQALQDLQIEKEKVETAYEELQRQERKRDEFLDTIAHELRTPLTAAKGYLQLVQAGVLEGPPLDAAVNKISLSFNRIISLVNDLLFVQEMELLDFGFSKVDVLQIVNQAIDEIQNTPEAETASIYLEAETDLPTILADPNGLARVFRHLLDNAVKFSPEGGEILVRATTTLDGIEISILDHGVGIPPEFMPRLFERFERVETYQSYLFGGLGLGLPIVKHIVESHGGNISVESQRGKGSLFTVHLPHDARRTTQNLRKDWIDVPEDLDE